MSADLADSGVVVGTIDPGGYRSKIREKIAMYILTGSDNLEEVSDEQKTQIQAAKEDNDELKEPDEVAEAVVHFLR